MIKQFHFLVFIQIKQNISSENKRTYSQSVPPMKKVSISSSLDSYLAAWTLKPKEGEQRGSHSSPSCQALFHPCLILCHHNPIVLPSFPKSLAVLFQRKKVLAICILIIHSFVQNRWQGLLATSITSVLYFNFLFLSAGPEASIFWRFWDLVRWIDFLTSILIRHNFGKECTWASILSSKNQNI